MVVFVLSRLLIGNVFGNIGYLFIVINNATLSYIQFAYVDIGIAN
jgi:hypothetical protein